MTPGIPIRLLALAVGVALLATAAPGEASADDPPLFTIRTDMQIAPGTIPIPQFGFGGIGIAPDGFVIGGHGFITPNPVAFIGGGEGIFGGVKAVKHDLRLGGEGVVGVFTVASPLIVAPAVGPTFGGFFRLLLSPPVEKRDFHLGFRFGGRVYLPFIPGYPLPYNPSGGPTIGVDLYFGTMGAAGSDDLRDLDDLDED